MLTCDIVQPRYAIGSTNPGAPNKPQYYEAKPGINYVNFKDANGMAITIPSEVDGKPILTAKLIFNGANWQAEYSATEINLVEYTKTSTIKELTTDFTPLDTPLEVGMQINQVYNGDGTLSSSGYWDTVLVRVEEGKRYKVNNVSGIALVRMVFFSGKPLENSVISFKGDGSTPITGTLDFPSGTKYVAFNFTKSNPTDASFYKGSSISLDLDENKLNLPVTLGDKVTYNRVAGGDGNTSGFTGDWDYLTVQIEEGKEYDIIGLRDIRLIVFHRSYPFSPSTLISYNSYNGTQRGRNFKAVTGAKYAAISVNKTGVPTSPATYEKAYVIQKGIMTNIISHHADNKIVMYGNSFFQGNYADDERSIQIALAPKVPNYNVINAGVGSETSLQILGRQGGIPMYLKNSVSIPANASTKVLIGNRTNGSTGIYSSLGYLFDNNPLQMAITLDNRDTSLINPVFIEGIECLLTWDSETENQYLQRTKNASQPYTTQPKAIINTRAMRELRNAWCNIFFLLTNDPFTNEDEMLSRYDKAIEYAGHGRYIVMSDWSDQRLTLLQMQSLENEMLKKYGARFFNLRKFAIERALPILGLTPSPGDQARMDDGLIPLVLTIDGLHPTTEMYALIAEQFYQIMLNTGVIQNY
ncbi:MAG: hypothetical protein EOO85_10400 [Pedobacter sp.]|nr:MAG: hypothetical protein EOO85_10400 [Pedobacter sp.]